MTEDFGIQEFKAFNSECGNLKTLNPEPRTFDPDPPKSI
jgi:hypothetical protein